MEVLVLGSGTGVPWPGRAPSSVLVKARSKNLLLDMGPGALQRLTQEGVDWQALDAILLSHLHPDHTLDLWAYFFASRWPGFARKEEVVLVAGRGLADLAQGLKAGYGDWLQPRPGLIRRIFLDPAQKNRLELFPGLGLETAPAAHPGQAMSFRLATGDKSLVYSGDTDYSEEVVGLSRRADLFILECAMPEGSKLQGHLTPSEAGRMAARAGAERLVLTHFYPETEGCDLLGPARKEFKGQVALAEDGLRIEV